MSWYGKGEDRVKHFRLYRELEAKYKEAHNKRTELDAERNDLSQRVIVLTDIISQKDDLIKRLAQELFQAYQERLPSNSYERSELFQKKLREALEAQETPPAPPSDPNSFQ